MNQFWTLIAVIVGGAMSYLVTWLHERRQTQRERAVRWDERRLDAHVVYLNTVSDQAMLIRRLAATRGFGHRLPAASLADGLDLLTEGEARRGVAFQVIEVLGDAATVEAAYELNRKLWHLEWCVRGLVHVDEAGWDDAYQAFRSARTDYYARVRDELQVPGAVPAMASDDRPMVGIDQEDP
ncbi:hypothetical protein [Actinomadura welshii]|uniref:hypothetical protein n=1 Tax=Actinomadura welshii TaxID=3103817 RepID=UPI0003ACE8E1|nr:hypothetical protein [Actinomadura madurae]